MITLHLDDRDIQAALRQLQGKVQNPRLVLKALGEHLAESTKRRFETSTAPDGAPWARNTEATLTRYLSGYSGSFKKRRTNRRSPTIWPRAAPSQGCEPLARIVGLRGANPIYLSELRSEQPRRAA